MSTSVFIFSNSCVAFALLVTSNDVFDPVVRGHVGGVVTSPRKYLIKDLSSHVGTRCRRIFV
jgi:hypothetical protein